MFTTVTTITLRTTLSLSLLAVAAMAVATEPADSISTDSIAAIEKAMSKKLDEVTVEGKTHWHNVKGSTYLPTKKQKNAASYGNRTTCLDGNP